MISVADELVTPEILAELASREVRALSDEELFKQSSIVAIYAQAIFNEVARRAAGPMDLTRMPPAGSA